MIQTHSGRATGRKTNGGTRPGVSACAQSRDRSRDQRKTRVPRPTQTPAAAPSTAHFNVLISSAVCSVYQRLSSARRGESSRTARLFRAAHLSRKPAIPFLSLVESPESAFRRTSEGPAEAGHYMQLEPF